MGADLNTVQTRCAFDRSGPRPALRHEQIRRTPPDEGKGRSATATEDRRSTGNAVAVAVSRRRLTSPSPSHVAVAVSRRRRRRRLTSPSHVAVDVAVSRRRRRRRSDTPMDSERPGSARSPFRMVRLAHRTGSGPGAGRARAQPRRERGLSERSKRAAGPLAERVPQRPSSEHAHGLPPARGASMLDHPFSPWGGTGGASPPVPVTKSPTRSGRSARSPCGKRPPGCGATPPLLPPSRSSSAVGKPR